MSAKVSKRLMAYVLDVFFIFLLINLIVGIKFINPYYDKYLKRVDSYYEAFESYKNGEIDDNKFTELTKENSYYLTKYGVSTNIVAIVVLFGYFGLFQKFNNGQTLGKKIMKIKVVDSKTSKNASLGRFLLRVLPIHFILVGNIITLLLSSIIVFVTGINTYYIASTIITYIMLFINIVSVIMMIKNDEHKSIPDYIGKTKVIEE